jgi:hypothetical protein
MGGENGHSRKHVGWGLLKQLPSDEHIATPAQGLVWVQPSNLGQAWRLWRHLLGLLESLSEDLGVRVRR